jgi:putative transposase
MRWMPQVFPRQQTQYNMRQPAVHSPAKEMDDMPYWRAFYHIVWTTKHRMPLITPEIEALIFPSIIHKAREMGAIVYALNGTTDHVHLAAAIPPRVAVAQLVGELKGRSSFIVNHRCDDNFAWQKGYGVHTFGERHLPWLINYVQRQKEHHADHTTRLPLEACLEDDNGPPVVSPNRALEGPSDG